MVREKKNTLRQLCGVECGGSGRSAHAVVGLIFHCPMSRLWSAVRALV